MPLKSLSKMALASSPRSTQPADPNVLTEVSQDLARWWNYGIDNHAQPKATHETKTQE